MDKKILIKRNKEFVIEVIDLMDQLPKSLLNSVFSRQLLRSASSVGAKYRSACLAKSHADFVNTLKIVEEGLDESLYFMELIQYANQGKFDQKLSQMEKETNELLSIYIALIITVKRKNDRLNCKSNTLKYA